MSAGMPSQPPPNEAVYRRNFPFFLADGILFVIALNIMGSTTTIPDFIRRLTDSEVLIGLSSNLFPIGWMLPQLLVARFIVRARRFKWWYVGPNIAARSAVLCFAVVTALLGPDKPRQVLLAFFLFYSAAAVGDGLVSIPSAQLIGTSLDGRYRARVYGLMLIISGLVMLALSPLIGAVLRDSALEFPYNYAVIFGAAGLVFALDILPIAFVRELPASDPPARLPAFRAFLASLGGVLRRDSSFRAMLAARMLHSLYAMAGPFYIGYATTRLGLSSTVAVPALLAMQTAGGILGALSLAWLGARRGLLHIRLALGAAALLPVSALLSALVGPAPLYAGFFFLGTATGSLVLGYQNWLIAYTTPAQRPVYAGLFTTLTGLVVLAAPLIGGTIAQRAGYLPLFGIALALVLAALAVNLRWVSRSSAP